MPAAHKKNKAMKNVQIFDSVRELLAVCNGPDKGSEAWKVLPASHEGEEAFTGTKTFEEAEGLLINGDIENAKKLGAAIPVNAPKGQSTLQRIRTAPTGFAPCVPNFLNGLPNNMLSIATHTAKAVKVLKIYAAINYWYGLEKEAIIKAGAALANAIYSLEKAGCRCELYAGGVYTLSKPYSAQKGSYFVKIKGAGEPLDILKVAFPLVNPSFLRRITFAVIEKTATKFSSNYGVCPRDTTFDLGGAVAINMDSCYHYSTEKFVSLILKLNKDYNG